MLGWDAIIIHWLNAGIKCMSCVLTLQVLPTGITTLSHVWLLPGVWMCFVSHENSPIYSSLHAVCTQTETRREISQRHTQSRPPVHTNSSTDTQIYIYPHPSLLRQQFLASLLWSALHALHVPTILADTAHTLYGAVVCHFSAFT